MGWEAWFTLAVVAVVFFAMAKGWNSPDVLLVAGVAAVAAAGVIGPADAFVGFSNEGMLTVAALFVVAAALRATGVLDLLGARVLGRARSANGALGRMALGLTGSSAFLNNTPIVAMMLPVVTDWCRKHGVSPSRLLIPLSYLTMLGGMCTLIGTSTNLVVSGLMAQVGEAADDPALREALRPVGFFEITALGLICAAVGALYLFTIGQKLLPDRKEFREQVGEAAREYLVDLEIRPGCRLSGQTVERAGLRHLEGLFLIEIARRDRIIAPVGPDDLLREGDRLTFTGVVASIVELERIPGLVPAGDGAAGGTADRRRGRHLCEAVISPTSPLSGKTIRDANFRALYNAAVVAVHRGGARLEGRLGDIVLRAGDTLLLQTGAHFARAHRNNPDFVLVSSVDDARPVRHDRAPLALALLALLIALMVSGVVSIVVAAFSVAALMLLTRCISSSDARESIDWQTLVCIAAAFGLGKALENSGAAAAIAGQIADGLGDLGPLFVLAALCLLTTLFTEMITNNAAAVLMFPFALAISQELGVDPRPFAIAIMFSASFAFATPIGYQTNMMVYGPGGYRFGDFTRVGLPLNVLLWIVVVLGVPFFWPF